jgi:pre-rRNA-processing protein IPI1
MGSSAKKKKEKKADFVKPKLKVGKARPKNTNATDTSFTAKSIILKQQSVSESRDATALFNHNLSLLSSKNETQRRDALQYLTAACLAAGKEGLPQPVSVVVAKAQPLILDGNSGVRQALLKLFKVLPPAEIGSLEQVLLYARAGVTHLSTDIRIHSLDLLDWLLNANGEALMACPGGWVKMLMTFQNLLGWKGAVMANGTIVDGKWTSTAKPSNTSTASSKLLVHQLNTLAQFLAVGLTSKSNEPLTSARRTAALFPLCHTDSHTLPTKSNSFGYLNLFGAPRDAESETYDSAEERMSIFVEQGLLEAFQLGVKEAKREGGEVGRAAAAIDKALKLADQG